MQSPSQPLKKEPPPLPMGALESAELDVEALRIAVIKAREAERQQGVDAHAVTGSRNLHEISSTDGRSAAELMDPPPTLATSEAPPKPREATNRATTSPKRRRSVSTKADRSAEGRKSSAVRVQVNERGRLAVGDKPLDGTLTDISLTGAFLASSRTLTPGSEVTLRFSLPVGEDGRVEKVEVRAEVRHRGRDQSGLGLRFLRMPADAMATIQRFLDENRPTD